MKIQSNSLISDLTATVQKHIGYAEHLKGRPLQELNYKATPESWSILECLGHLNLYGNFYLPEIEQRIRVSKTKAETDFKTGILGNYFANSMLPKAKLNKMKTFKNMNPNNERLNQTILDLFIAQQNRMLTLLHQSKSISLNKTKTSISITSLLKLKLGDTFRFVIYHNERHIQQAKRAEITALST
ncbi:DinB family protein [Flavobacterium sp. '19STA2R22 D10 B1']|uniref:DinB family protein n=1 Tax=Flavobacterium aerium TaxID=3037261 RepID=UPI00278C6824|nr:DinB family protein [Flavobacterium sp. '19STA2R22 D10 B1']